MSDNLSLADTFNLKHTTDLTELIERVTVAKEQLAALRSDAQQLAGGAALVARIDAIVGLFDQ
ncbi:hypothetical protein QU481_16955 [Crenobacter sp. SG2303]|uniref:DUF904 domain-containing protein n=1 Tax=Crenobacter oryzisoli TaxID=3056844 RepID=A0ABT7XRZ2_9NEIS|nr:MULTISPECIES: hypothetical protein [unclassified Crenobacter]MDN0076558.1 hypothetical protein [Crenobacter sp. SG2303]MDN0084558.1 hypothetical protein [Crenobacter sp. SG2305]